MRHSNISSDRNNFRVLQQEFLTRERYFDEHYLILSSPDRFRNIFKTFIKDLVQMDIGLLENEVIRFESFYFKNIHGKRHIDVDSTLYSISFSPYWNADKAMPGREIQHYIFYMDKGIIQKRFFVMVDPLDSPKACLSQIDGNGSSKICGTLEDSDIQTIYEYLQENSMKLLHTFSNLN